MQFHKCNLYYIQTCRNKSSVSSNLALHSVPTTLLKLLLPSKVIFRYLNWQNPMASPFLLTFVEFGIQTPLAILCLASPDSLCPHPLPLDSNLKGFEFLRVYLPHFHFTLVGWHLYNDKVTFLLIFIYLSPMSCFELWIYIKLPINTSSWMCQWPTQQIQTKHSFQNKPFPFLDSFSGSNNSIDFRLDADYSFYILKFNSFSIF